MNSNNIYPLGFGSMKIPNNQEEVNLLVDTAIFNGINYFELCSFYVNNQCEKLLSNALLKYKREDYYLCNKLPQSIFRQNDQKKNIEYFENRLKNSQVSYFDYFLVQCINEENYTFITDEFLNYLIDKKKQGVIKNLGFSYHGNIESFQKVIDLYDWDVVQLQLNYYDWYCGIGKDLYFMAKKNNLPIFVMQPCKSGMLINNLPEKSLMRLHNENIDPAELCYKFLTTLSQVKLVLSGIDTIDNLKKNLLFFKKQDFGITQVEKEQILLNIEDYKENNYINCSNCKYCLQSCPQNIPINELFQNYNKVLKDNDLVAKEYLYGKNSTDLSKRTPECKRCGACEKACPQHLQIRKLLFNNIRYIKR